MASAGGGGSEYLVNAVAAVPAEPHRQTPAPAGTPPPGLPNGYRGFSSYDAPPKPTDTTPLSVCLTRCSATGR